MARPLLALLALQFSTSIAAAQEIEAHFRPRPPEMVVSGDEYSGPLKDIADQAVAALGMTVHWTDVPFARTVKDLSEGAPILVPRFIRTSEREGFAIFLGPIAVAHQEIVFVVRKGDEHRIRQYRDLERLMVSAKRGTVYFEPFDHDPAIAKTLVTDDESMMVQLRAGRFDAGALIDPASFRASAAAAGWDGWTFADWSQPVDRPNYFAVAKAGPLAGLAPRLDAELKAMAADGTVKRIYAKYGLDPDHIE